MRGELDFGEALDARVALLKGLEDAAIDRCRAERVRLTPGARALVRTMAAHGAHTLLVSGGFTRFAGPVAAEIGFAEVRANVLGIEGEKLTGLVAKPIVDAEAKKQALARRGGGAGHRAGGDAGGRRRRERHSDGRRPPGSASPITPSRRWPPRRTPRIVANDLTALLYAQGYKRSRSGSRLKRAGSCRRRSRRARRRPNAAPMSKPMVDGVRGDRVDPAGDLAGVGMAQRHRGAERRAQAGLDDRAGGVDRAQRGRRGRVGDEHAHPPPPPARRHPVRCREFPYRRHAAPGSGAA